MASLWNQRMSRADFRCETNLRPFLTRFQPMCTLNPVGPVSFVENDG